MKFVFYDFETSGLSAPYDSIVQAAFILTDENFKIIDPNLKDVQEYIIKSMRML